MRRYYWLGPLVFVAIIAVFGLLFRNVISPRQEVLLVTPAIPKATPIPAAEGPVEGGCPVWGGRRLKSTNGHINVTFTMGLGRVSDDGETDQISLSEYEITADTYTPDVLGYPTVPIRKELELIRDTTRLQRIIQGYVAQPMRQIKGPEVLVDIVVKDQWEYEARFFKPELAGPKRDGLYTILGEPFSVIRFRNPDPPSTNKLEITRNINGVVEKSEYSYDATQDTWLLKVNGVEKARKASVVNPNNPCERIETRFDLKNGKLLKTVKVYQGFPWGQEIVKKTEDPDGKALTTRYKYFDDPNGPHYTFLKTTIYPNGQVEQHNQQPDPTFQPRRRP